MKREDVDKYARHEFKLAEIGVYDGELESVPFEISGATVLDLGAGPGIWCRFFEEAGAKFVLWVDISPRFLYHARPYLADFTTVRFAIGDMIAIPAKEEVFDLVYCRGSLHHSMDEAETFREIQRVLKPGGMAAVSAFRARRVTKEVPMSWKKPLHYLTPFAALLLGRKIAPTLYHFRRVVERNIEASGLELVEVDDSDPTVLWLYAVKPDSAGRRGSDPRASHSAGRRAPPITPGGAKHPVARVAKPLVSVVIPTYNRRRFCEAAVRSALAQTYRPIEIIVVDDGSTDDTKRVFASVKPPVRYIRQENSERAAARNRGIAEARGEYVAFLDSDDFWSRQHLEKAVEMLTAHPDAALAFGRAIYSTEGGIPVREAPSPQLRPGLCKSRRAVAAMSRNFVSFPLSSVVARRDVLLEHPFNEDRELSRSEDWELWMRIAVRYPVVATRDASTFIRIHSGNSSQEADLTARAMRRALELAFADSTAWDVLGPHESHLRSAMELELARLYAICGRKDEAHKILVSLRRGDEISLDRRALRRLRTMLFLPSPLVDVVRRLGIAADVVLGYPRRRGLIRELREIDVSPRKA